MKDLHNGRRHTIDPGWTSFADKTYVPAVVKAGTPMYVSGLNAVGEDGALRGEDDIVEQARAIYERLGQLLDAVGATPADVVRTMDYITTHDRDRYRDTADVRQDFFGDHQPASTGIVVSELFGRGVLIEIDAIVVL